mmetsp:Transcript_25779/g.58020  ORF Transcript_25779/g.58020 Transcript_25779/m.58020 type:complete len:100 (-) Transcript_25779:372-671(-)
MGTQKTLNSFHAQVALAKTLSILAMDLWVRVKICHPLYIDYQQLTVTCFPRKMAECLGQLIFCLNISIIVVVFYIITFQKWLDVYQLSTSFPELVNADR